MNSHEVILTQGKQKKICSQARKGGCTEENDIPEESEETNFYGVGRSSA